MIEIVSHKPSRFATTLKLYLKEVGYKVCITRSQQRPKAFVIPSNKKNKLQQLEAFTNANIPCPRFATNPADARAIRCTTLFARQLLNSTNGRGIVEFERSAEIYPRASLYTEYIKKLAEYRVHVFNGKVIDLQQKKKQKGVDHNFSIRNRANGWVYCREGVQLPEEVKQMAINATQALNYLYGAIDIIYNQYRDKYYILEVNTKPGLYGKTIISYGNAILEYLK